MTYYNDTDYKERWFIRFMDLNQGTWRVSIQDPTFTGTATELTPSANPLEWMGNGDQDQTNVIQGSTGTLRIMVTDASSIAGILPTELNNRRVKVTRNNVLMWIGYLKQEEYNQKWISVPYEVELPIISVLEVSQYIKINPSKSILNIASLLRQCVTDMGVSASIYSNIDKYIDYNGNKAGDYWVRNNLGIECQLEDILYETKGKPISDILTMIASPLGHIREYQGDWYIMLDRKNLKYKNGGTETTAPATNLYKLNDVNALVQNGTINSVSMSTIYTGIAGTNNYFGTISSPSSVEINESIEKGDENIFKMGNEIIVKKFTSDNLSHYNEKKIIVFQDDHVSQIINQGSSETYLFMKTFDGLSESCEMMMTFIGERYHRSVTIKPNRSVLSSSQCNRILLKVESKFGDLCDNRLTFYLSCDGKYYTNTSRYMGTWVDTKTPLTIDTKQGIEANNVKDGDNYLWYFNEPRTEGDLTRKYIELEISHGKETAAGIVIKISYEDKESDTAYLRIANEGVEIQEEKVETSGYGDEMTLNYYTFRGKDPFTYVGNYSSIVSTPSGGFYDQSLLDVQPREMLDLEEVNDATFSFLKKPSIVTDGNKTYIAVATGCNARNATTRLKLITTNI